MSCRNYATVGAALIGGAGVIIALLNFRTNRENQKEAVLQKAYFDYAKMALEHPALAFPFKANINLEKETLEDAQKSDDRKENFERYEWFLSSMLVMCLFVKKMRTDDRFWHGLVVNQMSYHWQYIEYFWNKKQFIINWRTRLEPEMIEGIKKGKANFSSE